MYLELIEWLLVGIICAEISRSADAVFLIQAIARHEALASMLAMPHMRPAEMRNEAHDNIGRVETAITYEGTASPRELLERINIQCSSFVVSIEAMKARHAEAIARDAEERVAIETAPLTGEDFELLSMPPVRKIPEAMDSEAQAMMNYA